MIDRLFEMIRKIVSIAIMMLFTPVLSERQDLTDQAANLQILVPGSYMQGTDDPV